MVSRAIPNLDHAVEFAIAFPDFQNLSFLIPGELDGCSFLYS